MGQDSSEVTISQGTPDSILRLLKPDTPADVRIQFQQLVHQLQESGCAADNLESAIHSAADSMKAPFDSPRPLVDLMSGAPNGETPDPSFAFDALAHQDALRQLDWIVQNWVEPQVWLPESGQVFGAEPEPVHLALPDDPNFGVTPSDGTVSVDGNSVADNPEPLSYYPDLSQLSPGTVLGDGSDPSMGAASPNTPPASGSGLQEFLDRLPTDRLESFSGGGCMGAVIAAIAVLAAILASGSLPTPSGAGSQQPSEGQTIERTVPSTPPATGTSNDTSGAGSDTTSRPHTDSRVPMYYEH